MVTAQTQSFRRIEDTEDKPHRQIILEHLQEFGSIHAMEAWHSYNILPGTMKKRISDLRCRHGYRGDIKTEMKETENGKEFAVYYWNGGE